MNIVTLKDLLGHAEITTTMIYLHVAQCPVIKPHSPLDTLYGDKNPEQNQKGNKHSYRTISLLRPQNPKLKNLKSLISP